MVKTVYTTFDGARFDTIKKAKQHEQEKTKGSAIRALGELLRQLKTGETLSPNESEYKFTRTYGDVFTGQYVTGFGLINTITVKTDNIFLADKFNTKYNTLTVRISWYESGQYSASCELGKEGLQFVQPLELNEDIDALIGQMQDYLSDEVHEVLKKTYKGEL